MSKVSLLHAAFSTTGLGLLAYAAWNHYLLVAIIGFLIAFQAINHFVVYRELWRSTLSSPPSPPTS